MNKPDAYSLTSYGGMVTNAPRTDAYVQALRKAVQPGCVVLDIGAGPGIFSLLACQFGAGHVHAVEPNDSIQVARTMAAANGFSDRITFHQGLSTNLILQQKADVIVSDLNGILPLLQQHIPSIIDARERLLAPGGVLIPRCDYLWTAIVEDPKIYRTYHEPWLRNDFGLDMSAGHPLVVNTWRRATAKSEQLLVEPQMWATLDFRTVQQPNFFGTISWEAKRSGTAHGILVWFESELADGVAFSSAPGKPELIYGQAFFPLQMPVELSKGDRIELALRAALIENDYVWSWDTRVLSKESDKLVKADFRQTTFFSTPISHEKLKHSEAGFVPGKTQDLEIDGICLSLINGETPLGDIAKQIMEQFPQRFLQWQDALSYVANLIAKYQA